MITALPGAFPLKPGCATLPFFGVAPVLLDDKGRELQVHLLLDCAGLSLHKLWATGTSAMLLPISCCGEQDSGTLQHCWSARARAAWAQ